MLPILSVTFILTARFFFHLRRELLQAWDLWSSGRAMELIDLWSSLHDEPQMNSILRCIQIALLCVQRNWADRPTMADVLLMLKCETMTLPVPGPPVGYTSGPVLSGGSANTSETASSTTYASAESDD
jgi:interleukin-1 receptor-associated kinase 1